MAGNESSSTTNSGDGGAIIACEHCRNGASEGLSCFCGVDPHAIKQPAGRSETRRIDPQPSQLPHGLTEKSGFAKGDKNFWPPER